MKILLASRNEKKVRELRSMLSAAIAEIEILSLDDVGYTEEIEENGTTFEENALIKARVGASLGYICVADDSGLEVDALDGAPGVYSARYCGYHASDAENNAKLLQEMAGVPTAQRTARYVAVIACVFPDGRAYTVRGTCEGRLLTEYHGDGGFGYDPLFYVEEYQKTFAQITAEEKNAISHRGKAMRAFCSFFSECMKGERDAEQ